MHKHVFIFLVSVIITGSIPTLADNTSPPSFSDQQISKKIDAFFSSSSVPANTLLMRQAWGIHDMLTMYDHYEAAYLKGQFLPSYSRLIEDSFKIAGVAYNFLGISCSFCVAASLLYAGYYLAPGWFYRVANFSYGALDGKEAYLPLTDFDFDDESDFSRSAFLQCEYYGSDQEIENNHRSDYSNYVKKSDIPKDLQDIYFYKTGRFDNTAYVVVPGRWLRLGDRASTFNHAAFATLTNAGALELACGFAGLKAAYSDLEKLKPVIRVENNNWSGSYPVFFYVEGKIKKGRKTQKVAAKLVPEEKKKPKDDCNCPVCP